MLRPLNKHIVGRLHEEEVKKGALILKAEPPKVFYDVLAVADGVTCVTPGDRIMIKERYGLDFAQDGDTVTLIHVDMVLGVCE